MKLKLYDFELTDIGRTTTDGKFMWGKISIGLKDVDHETISRVDINLFLARRPEVTFSELQTEARESAKTILQAALNHLKDHDIEGLEKLADENRKF